MFPIEIAQTTLGEHALAGLELGSRCGTAWSTGGMTMHPPPPAPFCLPPLIYLYEFTINFLFAQHMVGSAQSGGGCFKPEHLNYEKCQNSPALLHTILFGNHIYFSYTIFLKSKKSGPGHPQDTSWESATRTYLYEAGFSSDISTKQATATDWTQKQI